MRRDVLGQLMMVTKLLNADMDRSLGPIGLSMVRAHVLWELSGQPGMTQKMLADRLGVTPRNVTALIDALEATEYVERRPHPTDRRAFLLELTEKGAAFYAQSREGFGIFAGQLFGDLGRERLGLLHAELDQIVTKLSALAQSTSHPQFQPKLSHKS